MAQRTRVRLILSKVKGAAMYHMEIIISKVENRHSPVLLTERKKEPIQVMTYYASDLENLYAVLDDLTRR